MRFGGSPQRFHNIMIEKRFFFHFFPPWEMVWFVFILKFYFWNETGGPTWRSVLEGGVLRGQMHSCCLGYQGAPEMTVWTLGHWGIQDGSLRFPAMPLANMDRGIIDLLNHLNDLLESQIVNIFAVSMAMPAMWWQLQSSGRQYYYHLLLICSFVG